jgi:hypothetical protein
MRPEWEVVQERGYCKLANNEPKNRAFKLAPQPS